MSEPLNIRAERLTVDRPTATGREQITNHILSSHGSVKFDVEVLDGVLTVDKARVITPTGLADPGNGVPAGIRTPEATEEPVNGLPKAAGTPAVVDPADFWVLPENAIVTHALVKVVTAFAGGTSIEVGNLTDPDGLFTALTAALTADSVIVGSGALIDTLIGSDVDNDLTVKATATGTFTAGKATITLVWVDPS